MKSKNEQVAFAAINDGADERSGSGDTIMAASTSSDARNSTFAPENTAATSRQPDAVADVAVASLPLSLSAPRVGKPTHPVWGYFTLKPQAYKHSNGDTAECMHCNQIVRHHNKVLSVVRHLRKCRPFDVVLKRMDDAHQPEWLHAGTKRGSSANGGRESSRAGAKRQAVSTSRKENAVANTANNVVATASAANLASAAAAIAVATKVAMTNPNVAATPVHKSFGGNKTSNSSTIAVASTPPRPTATFSLSPQSQQLVSPACTSYPVTAHTRSAATAAAAAPTSYTCVVAISNAASRAVEYYASSAPTLTAGRGAVSALQHVEVAEIDAVDAASLANDLARVMCARNVDALCGAVTSSNTLVHQQARALLSGQYFPSRFFHGCARQALAMLVANVFGDDDSSAAPPSLSAFLATFTADCKRVAQLLAACEIGGEALCDAFATALSIGHDVDNDNSSSSGALDAMFRSLRTHASAVREALDAESDAAARDNIEVASLCAVVESASFVATLDKALAILEPIRAITSRLDAPGVMVSDVYQAFVVALPDAFRALASASPQETSALVSACERSFNAMAGAAHGLANLLDPRFLGDGMTREVQERVEDALFSFPAGDRIDVDAAANDADSACRQEAIYTQYTEFRVASLAERSKKSFRFQMLCKGRKSALQYWQSDGTFWPELQHVALKVFSMGVSVPRAVAGSTVAATTASAVNATA